MDTPRYSDFLGGLYKEASQAVEMRKIAAALDEMSDQELLTIYLELHPEQMAKLSGWQDSLASFSRSINQADSLQPRRPLSPEMLQRARKQQVTEPSKRGTDPDWMNPRTTSLPKKPAAPAKPVGDDWADNKVSPRPAPGKPKSPQDFTQASMRPGSEPDWMHRPGDRGFNIQRPKVGPAAPAGARAPQQAPHPAALATSSGGARPVPRPGPTTTPTATGRNAAMITSRVSDIPAGSQGNAQASNAWARAANTANAQAPATSKSKTSAAPGQKLLSLKGMMSKFRQAGLPNTKALAKV